MIGLYYPLCQKYTQGIAQLICHIDKYGYKHNCKAKLWTKPYISLIYSKSRNKAKDKAEAHPYYAVEESGREHTLLSE